MKIVIAPDSYKESLTAREVACLIEAGFREVFPEADYLLLPMADGGEGTVDAMVAATGGRVVAVEVTGPLGEPVKAQFGIAGDGRTGIVEMAAASGLALVPAALRDPMATTSHGTGELIRSALDAGVRHLVIGIGGSATNDGGAGMLQALGARLLDRGGRQIGRGGGQLAHLAQIDVSGLEPRLKECLIEAACDVTNPLTGPNGASAVYGPQKGATPEMVAQLDANLGHFSRLISRDLGMEVAGVAGSGAAGGMGAALLAFLGARLRPGIEIVMETVGLDAAIRTADLVITGEGRMDSQTICGKTPVGVARVAKRYGKPVIAIAGSLSSDVAVVHGHGIDAVFSVLNRTGSLDVALAAAAANVQLTARNVAATLNMALEMHAT